MKLNRVDPPFDKLWKHAYLVTNKENRRMVCLVNTKTQRTTISYAKYLMSVKLGRELTKEEQVDHIDNDKTNDDIDNLQLLTPEENRKKYQETQPHDIHGTSSMWHKGCRCDLCRAYMKQCSKNCKSYGKPKKTIEKVCPRCGSTFMVASKHKKQIYCSTLCANKTSAAIRMLVS